MNGRRPSRDGVANPPSAVLILVNAVLGATMLAAFYGLFLSRPF